MRTKVKTTPENIDLDTERSEIRNADQRIFLLLSQFNLHASKTPLPTKNQLQISEEIQSTSPAGAISIFNAIAQHIDAAALSQEENNNASQSILEAAKLRWMAVVNIGRKKKADGLKDSYVKATHLTVIERGGNAMNAENGDRETGKIIAKVIADRCVKMQNKHLNEESNATPSEIRQTLDALKITA